MHTAVCTFEDRAEAREAVDRLLEAGFDRDDVHLSHRHADGSEMGGEANDAWDGMEREVAMDRSRLTNLGNFFGRLFGKDDAHAGTYSSAVERGLYVVVVDSSDEAVASRAQGILHGTNAADLNMVHRPQHPPLRDIVGARQAAGMEQRLVTARSGMGPGPDTDARREGELARERATASQGWGEQRTLELRDQPEPDDVDRAPGLRHADDKDSDKPR